MCGIVGVINKDSPLELSRLEEMRDTFVYRGPDDSGSWVSDNGLVGFGHRRLSIIDTSKDGHQPMVDDQSGCVIAFNGEVYNYLEIRAQLETQGHQFRTKTDTEVILKAYLAYGKDCVEHFNGMFAIAIWDPREQSVFFLRDRLGIKPLYFYHDQNQFIFASEVKAIKAGLDEKPDVHAGLIDQYMSFGYLPGQNTMLDGIKRLLPGHSAVLRLDSWSFSIQQYWDLPDQAEQDQGESFYLEQGRSLLHSAIDLRLRSDVPLGIFLSGGIDSSAVVGLLAEKTEEQLKTYSVAYDFGKDYNETYYARMVSKRFNTDHHELFIKPDTFRDFIPDYIRLMDEPVTESAAISLYLLSRMTTQDVTVVLSGEGSDEVFGGYDLYQYMLVIERFRRILGARGATLTSYLGKLPGLRHSKIAKYLDLAAKPLEARYKGISTYDERMKDQLYSPGFRGALNSAANEEAEQFLSDLFTRGKRDDLSKMLYFDTKTWLVDDLLIKADRMSMAASLELRVPFLDYRVVEFGARLPSHYKIRGRQGKYLLKQMVKGLLPDEVVYRKKMGFPTPLKLMFQGALKDYCRDLLLSPTAKLAGYFDSNAMEKMIKQHVADQRDYHRELWQLVVLEEWLQQNA